MKKNTIYTIVAVAVLLVTVLISAIAVGMIDNPLNPNHFVGTWIGTTPEKEGSETWTFQRSVLGRWGTGTMDGWAFEYKYTATKIIMHVPDSMISPRFGVVTALTDYYTWDYYFSFDYSVFVLTVDGMDITFVKIA